jgi:type I restriction enzyme S subunit
MKLLKLLAEALLVGTVMSTGAVISHGSRPPIFLCPGTVSLRFSTRPVKLQKKVSALAPPIPGTVLFSSRATIGKLGIARVPLATNQGFANFIPKPFLESQYLAYLLQHYTPGITALAGSTTFKEVNRGAIRKIKIPVPTLSEQRRIVEILDQADALRKKHTEADAKAACILPALFHKMFGDPATNPKGWITERLDKVFRSFSGGTPSKRNESFWEGDIPWISPKDMRTLLLEDSEDHVTKDAIAQSAANLIPPQSILLVFRSGILAHSVPVGITTRSVAFNQDLKALIPSHDNLSPWFALGWCLAAKQLLLSCVKKGATVHSIDNSKFQALEFIIPPTALQSTFEKNFKEIIAIEDIRHSAQEKLERLFATLLHRAFSGDLTAKWRDSRMKRLLAEMAEQVVLIEESQ